MPTMMLSRLRAVIRGEEANPAIHRLRLQQSRRDWPELWAALDELCGMDDASPTKGPGRYGPTGRFIADEEPPGSVIKSNGAHP